jgi:uncharacterized protein (TIGR02246 family)
MTRQLAVLILSSILISASANAQDAVQEAAIRAIVSDQATSWNAGNAAEFCQSAAPDISAFNTSGADMSGKARFCQRQQQILAGIFKGTTKKQLIRRLRFITDDVAIVDIDNEIHGLTTTPSGAPLSGDGVSRTLLMEIFVRRDGRWLMEAFHNIDLAAPK